MHCEKVRQYIELFVLGGLSDAENGRIAVHLADCPDCSGIEVDYRKLVNSIKQASVSVAGDGDLQETIMLSVRQELGSVPARRGRYRTILISGIAASLLVFVGLWQFWERSDDAMRLPNTANVDNINSLGMGLESFFDGARAVPTSDADDMIVRGRSVYLLAEDGLRANVAAFNPMTGQQKWKSQAESYGFIAADESRVYCFSPGDSGQIDLIAIDMADGQTIWRYPQKTAGILRELCKPAVLANGKVCWTINSTVHVLNASDGAVLWSQTIAEKSVLSGAAGKNGKVYVASSEKVYCFDVESARMEWERKFEIEASRWVRPLVAVEDGRICVGLRLEAGGSYLVCLNLAGTEQIWAKGLRGVSNLCIAMGRVYTRSQDIQALDIKTGDILWSYDSQGCSPLTYAEGWVCFVDTNEQGGLIALDGGTGNEIWHLEAMQSCNAFVRMGSTGYLKTHDGVVHVISFKG